MKKDSTESLNTLLGKTERVRCSRMSPLQSVRDHLQSASNPAFPNGLIKEQKELALTGTRTMPDTAGCLTCHLVFIASL